MWLHTFITLALDGGELSSFYLGHLTHHEKVPHYPLEEKLDGPHNLSDAVEKSLLLLGIIP
jgi:hypothetical protein